MSCICFPRRKKHSLSPYTTLHPYRPTVLSYAPDPIYNLPPPTAALPSTPTIATIGRSYQPTFPLPSYASHSIYNPPQPTAALPTIPLFATTGRSYQPTFPLHPKPSCRHCHHTPEVRLTVGPKNENGNGYRPYYVCARAQCEEKKDATTTNSGAYGKGWITWDDNKGVEPGNPNCYCGFIARQDRTGVRSRAPGMGFWTCCTGACGYVSWRADGLTVGEADGWNEGFVPWLI